MFERIRLSAGARAFIAAAIVASGSITQVPAQADPGAPGLDLSVDVGDAVPSNDASLDAAEDARDAASRAVEQVTGSARRDPTKNDADVDIPDLPPLNTVVSPNRMGPWVFRETSCGGTNTGSIGFTEGPATPPAGKGSLRFATGADGTTQEEIGTSGLDGLDLDDIDAFAYSTYVDAAMPGGGDQAPYLLLTLDTDGDGVEDDILIFEPEYQNGYRLDIPQQGPLGAGAWQTWDAGNGGWWSVAATLGATGGTNTVTLAEYLAARPAAELTDGTGALTSGRGLRVVAGCGGTEWADIVAYADLLQVAIVGAADHESDFDPSPLSPTVHIDSGDNFVDATEQSALSLNGTYDNTNPNINRVRVTLYNNAACSGAGIGPVAATLDPVTGTWTAGPFDVSSEAMFPEGAVLCASGNAMLVNGDTSPRAISDNMPVIDTLGPTATIDLLDGNGVVNALEAAGGVDVSWEVDGTGPAVTVSVMNTGSPAPPDCVYSGQPRGPVTGTVQPLCFSALANGPIQVMVEGTDDAGNPASATDDSTLDTSSAIRHCVNKVDPVCDDTHPTIADAIAHAVNGDIVDVGPGSYAENVTIDKSISFLGANDGTPGSGARGAESWLQGTGAGFAVVYVTAPNVLISGFQVEQSGFASDVVGILGGSNLTIVNSIIRGNTFGAGEFAGPVTISNNWFDSNNLGGAASGDGIYNDSAGLMDVSISGNLFTGHTSASMVFAPSSAGAKYDNISVQNNTFQGDNSMVFFHSTNVLVRRNTSTGSMGSIVFVGGGVDGMQIRQNSFTVGSFRALRVAPDFFGYPEPNQSVSLNFNNIEGNGSAFDVEVSDGRHIGDVDAEDNWWGCMTGPGTLGCDTASTNVDYTPWLRTSLDINGAIPPTFNVDGGEDGFLTGSEIGGGITLSGVYDASDPSIGGITAYVSPSADCDLTGATPAQEATLDSGTGTWSAGPFDISGYPGGTTLSGCAQAHGSPPVSSLNFSYVAPVIDLGVAAGTVSFEEPDGSLNEADLVACSLNPADCTAVKWAAAEADAISATGRFLNGDMTMPAGANCGPFAGLPPSDPFTGYGYLNDTCASALAQGPIIWEVTWTDGAGNESAPAQATLTKDTIAPAAPTLTSPADGFLTNDTTFDVSGGAAEEGATVTVTRDGTPMAPTATGQPDGSWLTSLTFPEGSFVLRAFQTDLAGNPGPASDPSVGVTVDITAPPPPTVTFEDPNGIINSSEAAATDVSVDGESGAGYALTVTDGDGNTATANGTLASASTETLDVSGLTPGTLTATATLTDPAGNEGTAGSDTATLDLDGPGAPSVTFTTDPVNASNQTNVNVLILGEGGGSASLTIGDTDGGTPDIVDSFGFDGGAGRQYDVSSQAEGILTVTVTITDTGGNPSPPGSDTVLKDTVVAAPVVDILDDLINAAESTAVQIQVSGEDGSAVALSVDDTDPLTAAVTDNGTLGSTTTFTLDISSLSPGTITATASLTDPSGNPSADGTDTATLDESVATPTVTFLDTLINDAESTAVQIEVDGEGGSTVEISVDDTDPLTDPVTDTGATASAVTFTANLSSLSDGLLTATATLTDAAGNTSGEGTANATLDTIVLPGTLTSDDANGFVRLLEITGCDSGTGAGCPADHWDANPSSDAINATLWWQTTVGVIPAGCGPYAGVDPTRTGWLPADCSGNFADGSLHRYIYWVDAAGNQSTSVSYELVKDTVAPDAPTISLDTNPINQGNQTAVQVSGTAEMDASVFVAMSATVNATDVADDGTYMVTLDASSIGDGPIGVESTATDPAGNTGPTASAIASKDTIAPDPTAVSFDDVSGTVGASETGAVPLTVDGESGATANVSITDESALTDPVTGGGELASPTTFLFDVTGQVDGTLTATVTLTDPAGNTGNPLADTVTLDTASPPAGTVDIVDGDGFTSFDEATAPGDPVPAGWTDPGGTVSASVWFEDAAGNIPGDCGPFAVGPAGLGSVNFTCAGNLPEGTYFFKGQWFDAGGNASDIAADSSVMDRLAPAAPTIDSPPGGFLTNDPAITVSGSSAEENAAVTITRDGTAMAPTGLGQPDGSYMTTITFPEGSWFLRAFQTDVAGNAGPVSDPSVPITVDLTAPGAPTVTFDDPNGLINASEATGTPVTVDGEGGADYVLTVSDADGDSVMETGTLASSSTETLDVSGLTPGTLTATATLTDPAGNESIEGSDTATLDTGAPVPGTVSFEEPDGFLSASELAACVLSAADCIAVKWTAGDADAVSATGRFIGSDGLVPPTNCGPFGLPPSDPFTGAGYLNGDCATGLPEGNVTWEVVWTDSAGNTSEPATATIDKDTIAPGAPTITVDTDPITQANQTAVHISGTAEMGASVFVALSATVNDTDLASDGTYAVTLDATSLADGPVGAEASATDPAGNTGPTASDLATKDTTAVAPTISFDDSDGLINADEAAAPGTPITVSGEDGSTVDITVTDEGGDQVTAQTTLASPSTVLVPVSSLADGTLSATAVLTDPVGNVSPVGGPDTATLDTIAPTGTVTFDEPDGFLNATELAGCDPGGTATGCIPVTWTADGGSGAVSASVWFEDEGGIPVSLPPGCGPFGAGPTAAGYLNRPCGDALDEGAISFVATWTDAAGNTSEPATATIDKDTIAPGAPTITVDTDPITQANQTAVHISGTAEMGASVFVALSATVNDTDLASDGTYAVTLDATSLADGPVGAEASATDPAGNTGPTASDLATKDTTAVAPTIDILDTLVNADEALTMDIEVSGEDGSHVDITITDEDGNTVEADADLASTVTIEVNVLSPVRLSDGTLTATGVLTDPVGNVSAEGSDTTVLDTVVLAGTLTSLDANGYTNASEAGAGCDNATGAGCSMDEWEANAGSDAIAATLWWEDSTGIPALCGPFPGIAPTRTGWLTTDCAANMIDGTISRHITWQDTAGNSSDELSYDLTLDTLAPDAPVLGFDTNPITQANQTGVIVSGTAEPDSTVDVSIFAGSVFDFGSDVADAAGDFSVGGLDASAMDDGTVSATATATDPAGNTSPTGGPAFATKDATALAPTIDILDTLVNADEALTMDIEVSGEDGSHVDITITDEDGNTVEADADLASTVTIEVNVLSPVRLSDGTLTATGVLTDPVGNVSAEGSDTTVLDTIVLGGVATFEEPDGFLNEAERLACVADSTACIDVRWTPDAGSDATSATARFVGSDGLVPPTNCGPFGPLPVADPFSGYGYLNGDCATGLPQDEVVWEVVWTDAAGNLSVPATDTIVKDTIFPTATIDVLDVDGEISVDEAGGVPVSWELTDLGPLVTISVYNIGSLAPAACTYTDQPRGPVTGGITAACLLALVEGPAQAMVAGVDDAGNPGAATDDTDIDIRLPQPGTVAFDEPDGFLNAAELAGCGPAGSTGCILVTWTSPTDADNLSAVGRFLNANGTMPAGGACGPFGLPVANPEPISSYYLNRTCADLLAEGTIFWAVKWLDLDLNETVEITDYIAKDITAPGGPFFITPADAEGFPPGSDVLVSGNSEPNATIALRRLGVFDPFASATADGDGDWSRNVQGLEEGHYAIVGKQTDEAGNPGGEAIRSFDIDRNVPVITSPGQGSDNASPVTIGGTGKPGSIVEVLEGSSTVGSTQVRASGNWSVEVGLASGVHVVRARGLSGNATPSAPRSFTVEANRPSVAMTTADRSAFLGQPAKIDGTAADIDDGVVRVRVEYFDLRGIRVAEGDATCAMCGAGALSVTWTHTPTLTLPGVYVAVAMAFDAGGIRSRTASITFLKA